jgi:small subunit ribosomal protein S16
VTKRATVTSKEHLMVKIRLKRLGRKKRPFYRIVVMDIRTRMQGVSLAELGFYNPLTRELKLDKQTAESWVQKGAIASETVAKLMQKAPDSGDLIILEKARKERLSKKAHSRTQEAEKAKAEPAAPEKAEAEAPPVEEAKIEETTAPVEEAVPEKVEEPIAEVASEPSAKATDEPIPTVAESEPVPEAAVDEPAPAEPEAEPVPETAAEKA